MGTAGQQQGENVTPFKARAKEAVLIGIALACVFAYEQCRPGLMPQRNAPEVENADVHGTKAASPIKGKVTATDLLEAFRKDEKKAAAEYVGQTYLIRGLVGGGSESPRPGADNPAPWYALLLSEHDHSLARLLRYIKPSPSASGVYCKFNYPFSPYARPKNSEFSRRIKELLLKCTIEGFGTPAVGGNPDEVSAATGQVVTSDCSVVDYVLYDR